MIYGFDNGSTKTPIETVLPDVADQRDTCQDSEEAQSAVLSLPLAPEVLEDKLTNRRNLLLPLTENEARMRSCTPDVAAEAPNVLKVREMKRS